MQVISKLVETLATLIANTALKIADGVQDRREKKRPKLDPRIESLSLDEAVRKAEAQRAYQKSRGGTDDNGP